jgi:thioredoxin 1
LGFVIIKNVKKFKVLTGGEFMLIQITDSNFEENLKNTSSLFVVVFSSPWCGICQKVVPRVEAVSKKYDKVKFGKIDITANTKKPSEFHVLTVPSIIIFKDGEEKERITGDIPEQELAEKVEEAA